MFDGSDRLTTCTLLEISAVRDFVQSNVWCFLQASYR